MKISFRLEDVDSFIIYIEAPASTEAGITLSYCTMDGEMDRCLTGQKYQ